ncbi:MAG: DUF481 domain-containing protein [Gammaproteobacteria bacterium]|nr:DUF481 domain-containing protein [Gammaproteobacteria bacterium]
MSYIFARIDYENPLTVRHISDVPVGSKETDSETAVTLVYGF